MIEVTFDLLVYLTAEGGPIVDDHAGADDVRATVDGPGHQGDLKEGGEFVLIGGRGPWMDEAALIGQGAVGADEDVVGHGLSEHFDLEHVGQNLLGLAVQVRMDEGDVVVAGNHISESRETFFNSLDSHRVRERISDLLQFLQNFKLFIKMRQKTPTIS